MGKSLRSHYRLLLRDSVSRAYLPDSKAKPRDVGAGVRMDDHHARHQHVLVHRSQCASALGAGHPIRYRSAACLWRTLLRVRVLELQHVAGRVGDALLLYLPSPLLLLVQLHSILLRDRDVTQRLLRLRPHVPLVLEFLLPPVQVVLFSE